MACSTERGPRGRILCLLLAGLLGQGCATGALFDAGRRTETVLSYQEAFTDGERLWLVYDTEISNRRGEPVAQASRTAILALEDLDPARGHPLDALPMERTAEAAPISLELRRVRVESRAARSSPAGSEPHLLVEETNGRATGFTLVAFEDLPAESRLHSGSLIERETAPWVYPLLPLAVAYDAVAVPTTALFAIPFFVIGD